MVEQVPDESGVYMVHKGDQCVYIGQSLRARRRLLGHNYRERFLATEVDGVDFIGCSDPKDRITLESALIRKNLPMFNKHGDVPGSIQVKIAKTNKTIVSIAFTDKDMDGIERLKKHIAKEFGYSSTSQAVRTALLYAIKNMSRIKIGI